MVKKNIINLNNVSLDIPIVSKRDQTIKKSFLKAVTGGRLSFKKNKTSIRALNSININIKSGEKIALIGHNGSGKTSFIKLISGIYKETSGKIIRNVEVYPMLQKSFLVSDYLTGIDSAKAHYLLLNNNLKNFSQYLDDIVSFSGLGDFISLPLRTYSEGMASRLMFSMLTYHSHACLALDEGLGTGDSSFYEKAERRLDQFIKKSGTLILASHSDSLLRRFCKRGLVFSKGTVVYDGKLEEALTYYDKNRN